MTARTDNEGNVTCYTYDALHRLTDAGSSSPTTSSICRHYRYDNSATPYNGGTAPSGVSVVNTMARLKEASTDHCTYTSLLTDEWFSYSARGELTDVYESTPHSGSYYHTTTGYWASGALESLSGIPSVPTIYYGASGGAGLDGEGRYTQVTASSGTNPMPSASYSTSSTASVLGALSGVTYGSSDSDSFGYDPNTGRPTGYIFNVGSYANTSTLTWNTNGTLKTLAISDAIPGTSDSETCGYTYDDLGRVGGKDTNNYNVDCGSSKWQQYFTYDAFGNITKSGDGSFAPTYVSATNQFTLLGLASYDGNGNMTSDAQNTYTWDPNWGTLASINAKTAVYDALGEVVEQQTASGYAEVLYSPVGKVALMNGSSLTDAFVGLPGGGTAVYASAGLAYYRHADWLGSSRLASTPSRTLYSSTAYAPYGETYATAGTTDQNFTGMNSDTVSSLYDFPARRLNPYQGRWISPDPSGIAAVDPSTPQTWNRYAYVAGNPMSFVDPQGLNMQGGVGTISGAGASGCDSSEYDCAADIATEDGLGWLAPINGQSLFGITITSQIYDIGPSQQFPGQDAYGMATTTAQNGIPPSLLSSLLPNIQMPLFSSSLPIPNNPTMKPGTRPQCAADIADAEYSIAAHTSGSLPSNPVVQGLLGNSVSGLYDLATAPSLGSALTDLFTGGYNPGIPTGNPISGGAAGVATSGLIKAGMTNVTKVSSDEVAGIAGEVKLLYDGASYLYAYVHDCGNP